MDSWWPELTATQISKYSKTTTAATIKGYQHAKRSNIQPNQKFRHPTLPLTFAAAAANVSTIPTPPPSELKTRKKQVFISLQEPTGRIFADQTGKLVCPSHKGIFSLYDYDSNSISAEPIPSREQTLSRDARKK